MGFFDKLFRNKPNDSVISSITELNKQDDLLNRDKPSLDFGKDDIGQKVKNFFVGILEQPCKAIYHGVATAFYGLTASAESVFWGTKTRQEPLDLHSTKFKDAALLTTTFGISSLFTKSSSQEIQAPVLAEPTQPTIQPSRDLNQSVSPVTQSVINQAREAGESLHATGMV